MARSVRQVELQLASEAGAARRAICSRRALRAFVRERPRGYHGTPAGLPVISCRPCPQVRRWLLGSLMDVDAVVWKWKWLRNWARSTAASYQLPATSASLTKRTRVR